MTDPLAQQNTDPEPDIVLAVLQRIRVHLPATPPELLASIEADIKTQYGGQRVRIPKRRKHLNPAERAHVYTQGLTAATDQQIQAETGVSRATIYRIMKTGPSRLS